MESSFLKFALIALIAVCVCADVHSAKQSRMNIRKRTSSVPNGVRFTPHSLPCQYSIVENAHVEQGTASEDQLATFRVHGNYFKVAYDIDEGYFLEQLLLRPDINFPDSDSDKVYLEAFHAMHGAANGAENYLIEEGRIQGVLHSELEWYLSDWEMINETTGEYHGQKCQVFYDYDEDYNMNVYLYADFDNYIIGFRAESTNYFQERNCTYAFSNQLKDFYLNQTLFPTVNDSRAFVPPTGKDPCP